MGDFLEKTWWLWLILIIIAIVLGVKECENYTSDYPTSEGIGFNTIVIDSCEYLIGRETYAGFMAHKGNCKFCKERNLNK